MTRNARLYHWPTNTLDCYHVPYQVFAVRDGHVMLAIGNDSQFQRLCAALERSALAYDPRFATNQNRPFIGDCAKRSAIAGRVTSHR